MCLLLSYYGVDQHYRRCRPYKSYKSYKKLNSFIGVFNIICLGGVHLVKASMWLLKTVAA